MLPSTKNWLKVAAGDKAKVLVDVAHEAPSGGLAIEVGTYCGFSAALLSAALRAKCHDNPTRVKPYHPQVVSLEVDAAHTAIAENLLVFAGLAHVVEVLTGHSEDVLPWLVT